VIQTSTAPCLYCRRTDVRRTSEHVLQQAFGAAAELAHEVCGDCNAAFSPIDKSFVEGVRFYYTGEDMLRFLRSPRTSLPDGTMVNVRLQRDGTGWFPPQLYAKSPTQWRFLGAAEGDLHVMLHELSQPALLKLKSEVVEPGDNVPLVTIVRSAPFVYSIQGTDAARVERLLSLARTEGLHHEWIGESRSPSDGSTPPITFDASLALGPFCRAMAKVALNFVCYRLGARVALQPEFDAVRRFARYGEGTFADFVVPTLLNHDLSEAAAAFVGPEHSALSLLAAPEVKRESVLLAIHGKTIGKVDLTRGTPALPPGIWLLTRFADSEPRVDDMTLPDEMVRAVLNPAAVGLRDAWNALGL
jgi:hypothetical protein